MGSLVAVVPEVMHTLVFAVFLASDLVDFVITLFAQLLLVFAKYVIELASCRSGWLCAFLKYFDTDLTAGTSALGRTAVEGDVDGVRRTPSLVWLDDVQQMSRMMLLVSGETLWQHTHGATCFSGASVDKVSFKTTRSVDVPPPGGTQLTAPGSLALKGLQPKSSGSRSSDKTKGTETQEPARLIGVSAHADEL